MHDKLLGILTYMDTWAELIHRYEYGNRQAGRIPSTVSQHANYCFVHIPKTGGNAFKHHLHESKHEGRSQNIDAGSGHYMSPKQHSSQKLFSIVRNPFAWLISMWHYNWPGSKHFRGMQVQSAWPDLETFLYEFNSHEKSKKSGWNDFAKEKWPLFSFRHLQTCQTFDPLDTVPGPKHSYASFYIRLEQLSEATQIMKMSDKSIPMINTSKHADYRRYYSTHLIDHITKHRQQELDILGYNFEGPTDDLSIFKVTTPFLWCGGAS